jgi:hypothetical protein
LPLAFSISPDARIPLPDTGFRVGRALSSRSGGMLLRPVSAREMPISLDKEHFYVNFFC